MKKKVFLICLIFISMIACKSPETPEPPPVKKATLVQDGDFTRSMTSYGCPQYEGYVKNIGNNTAYNTMVEISCYSDTAKTTIIDTATGFPADLGDIPPNVRAYFNAIAFDLNSWEQIKAETCKITWLDR